MNAKWSFPILLVILAFFGVNLERSSVPNQEIVVKFNHGSVSDNEAENTIALVRKKLKNIGVAQIKVQALKNGQLKITYFSDVNVADIQKIFASTNALAFSHTTDGQKIPFQFPSEDDLISYQLNVSEIQTSVDADMDFDGNIIEFKSTSNRYTSPNVYFSNAEIAIHEQNRIEKIAYKVYEKNALFIDNTSHNIPEVRAGPFS